MGWKKWVIILVLVVVVVWWLWRKFGGGNGREIAFTGLKPLTGGWKAMKEYVGGLGGFLLDDEELPSTRRKKSPVVKKPRILRVLDTNLREPVVADPTDEESEVDLNEQEPEVLEYYPENVMYIPKSWSFVDISGSYKRERIVRRVLETLFDREFPSIRPDWLRNPETNCKLEIDCYNEELGLAVEHQGEQHYRYTPSFHKDRHCFLKQIYRDRIKKQLILDHQGTNGRGTDYLAVPYNIRQDQIPQYIVSHLEELGYVRGEK